LHKKLAVEFTSTGDLRSAEMHFRAALWLQPDDPETFCHLANALLHDSNLEKNQAREEAVSDYKVALRLKPDFMEAKNQLRALGVPATE
jgi:tetratricopeptide (TPR) repeat protein